jgi:hypothetical protein
MSQDDERGRKERAARLRRQIDRTLKREGPDSESAKPPAPRSARDFIHDKMREQAGKKRR